MSKELKDNILEMIAVWTVKPSGFIIHQRKDKVRALMRKYDVTSVEYITSEKLEAFRKDLDDLITGNSND